MFSLYLIWSDAILEPLGPYQEGVRCGFAMLHLRVVPRQHEVMEQGEEFAVVDRLHVERLSCGAGDDCDGNAMAVEVPHKLVCPWNVQKLQIYTTVLY